jgi:hypothetical protein
VARRRDTFRAAALITAGLFAVHQLRYLLAYGAGAGDALGRQGHAYLGPALPALSIALALACARVVLRATGTPAGRSPGAQRMLVVWPVCAATILVLYGAQESAEGVLAAGHPAGLAGVFGHGGWIAAPLAIVAGLAVATALHIGERLEARPHAILEDLSSALPRPAGALIASAPYVAVPGAQRARRGACRGPPALCC